ncbi:glycoside hydrolase family 32 protein [Nocardioides limicola]|uniref:glycoside hydrolase family 32 protein n=1 Tax=Nocardioides limicola TaxID=2803368 RepID=UPI00193B8E27|nr:glycoside hydrolase family 32 protein [Nocardioides sp. DJM-14]
MAAEPFRPTYHFTPQRNWMNDPNGLVHYEGEYHLFFQYNPHGTDWGNMSWGHAVSPDLVHWQELPVALAATEAEEIFSGSVVVDHDNTSGLAGSSGQVPLVAIYTSVDTGTGIQAQSIAFSLDRGRSWQRYADNPVLDLGSTEFRDPKVFRHHDHWVMVVVLADDRVIQFYRSDDLLSWTHLSDFGPAGALDGVWECPDLVWLPEPETAGGGRWVLVVSVQDGAPAGGSGMQYFLGDFDGVAFTADGAARWFDHGADCYAAVSFDNAPAGLMIGWLGNWAYQKSVPTESFRGAMTLPRRCALRRSGADLRLAQEPVLPQLGPPTLELGSTDVESGERPLPVTGSALLVELTLVAGSTGFAGIAVRVGGAERTLIGYDADAGELVLDRTRSGAVDVGDGFAARHRAAYRPVDGSIRVRILIDTCSVEVFAGDGEIVLTDQVFPSPTSTGLALVAEGVGMEVTTLVVRPVLAVDPR